MKTFLILGGNFTNNGAASMTYITVQEIRKKYPDSKIYMISPMDYRDNHDDLTFDVINSLSHNAIMYFMDDKKCIRFVKALAKKVLNKGNDFNSFQIWKRLLDDCDGVFDISGYAISSQWGEAMTNYFCDYVNLFAKYNIPYYVMPQSIGPFDYPNNKKEIVSSLRSALTKCAMVFTREQEGYKLLNEIGVNANVKMSTDMVLQTPQIQTSYIYRNSIYTKTYNIKGNDIVGVIPNIRNYDHAEKEKVFNLYCNIIKELLAEGNRVLIMCHSKEDREMCMDIKKAFSENNDVILLEEALSSFEYQILVRKCKFIVASRFHAIVHAYKEFIPCIALGWATKYRELLELVNQNGFIFDVRDMNNLDQLLIAVKVMNERYFDESIKIKRRMEEIQRENCFDLIEF